MWNAGKEAVADLATASASAGKTSDKQRADAPDAGIGRRAFMSAATASMLTAWLPALRVSPSSAQATCEPPPNFPSTIALYQEAYENWSQEIPDLVALDLRASKSFRGPAGGGVGASQQLPGAPER